MGSRHVAVAAAVACALVAGCSSGTGRADRAASDAPLEQLSAAQLDAALLTRRTVGPTYRRSDAGETAVSGSLGCLDALAPSLLGADQPGRVVAEAGYVARGELATSVTSVVVSFASERAVEAAVEAFSVAAGSCTDVALDDGVLTTELEVTSRLVPPTAPVRREVLVEARGNVSNGVTAPAVGVAIKIGWVDHHLLAVETAGAGTYAPDITPYFNTARTRLLAVVAGTDPGPGRPVRDAG